MGAVGSGGHCGVLEVEVLAGEEVRAVGERDVIGGKAVLGGGGGGDGENGAGAKAEEEDGAVGCGEGGESAVEGLMPHAGADDEVEMAEDG